MIIGTWRNQQLKLLRLKIQPIITLGIKQRDVYEESLQLQMFTSQTAAIQIDNAAPNIVEKQE